MKKLFGLKIGGLQSKILNLVLFFLIATVGTFGVVSYYQSKELAKVVDDAKTKQQLSIEKVSGGTMQQVIDKSMTKTNALQAYVADDMFSEVKNDVHMM